MLPRSKITNAAGVRNNEVTIQVATDGEPNSMGEVKPVYLTSYKRWCETALTSGREFTAAMSIQPMLNAIIKLPHDSVTKSITPRDRIVDGGKVFNIAEVVNEGTNNEKMVLWCIRVD